MEDADLFATFVDFGVFVRLEHLQQKILTSDRIVRTVKLAELISDLHAEEYRSSSVDYRAFADWTCPANSECNTAAVRSIIG